MERATGERTVNFIGYCLGGTLLGCTLAWLAARGEDRVGSATFFVSLLDFSEPGELGLFIDASELSALDALMPKKVEADTSKALICPMPGLVKSLLVKAGQEIKAGEVLCIVEAMKMENVLRAERDATITVIHAKEGESIAVDAVIMEFA